VVERAAWEDRQLGVGPGDECRSRGNCPVSTRDQDSLCPALHRLLEVALELGRLHGIELEPCGLESVPRLFSVAAGSVEKSFGAGSGR
jgi:hypothetical protein